MLEPQDDGNALTKDDPQSFDPDVEIAEILGRIVGDGRDLAEAEFELIKAKALSEAVQYKKPAVLLVVAAGFAIAALIVAVIAVSAALATLIGPLAGGLVAAAIAAGIAYLCASSAIARMEKLR
ncbi:phage holin family protein [Sphingomicrobium clamense]|uniref:Phage holin family protein n=1 Tax=Sphingomicrobium clamense TaxID=2851013 RepID=A0ABS6V6A1_9SPHN|nr:phage holin family protein [Sphingomicrobium sp. B8]MBW0145097.1 phage holin family protein [Sphingomicrobium sp. B8]